VRRAAKGVHYVANLVRLQNTRVHAISFTPIRKVWLSFIRFSWKSQFFGRVADLHPKL